MSKQSENINNEKAELKVMISSKRLIGTNW